MAILDGVEDSREAAPEAAVLLPVEATGVVVAVFEAVIVAGAVQTFGVDLQEVVVAFAADEVAAAGLLHLYWRP